jgi:hypothetical protein
MAADHDINRLSQALVVAITAEDERGNTFLPRIQRTRSATAEKSTCLYHGEQHFSLQLIRRLEVRDAL